MYIVGNYFDVVDNREGEFTICDTLEEAKEQAKYYMNDSDPHVVICDCGNLNIVAEGLIPKPQFTWYMD